MTYGAYDSRWLSTWRRARFKADQEEHKRAVVAMPLLPRRLPQLQ